MNTMDDVIANKVFRESSHVAPFAKSPSCYGLTFLLVCVITIGIKHMREAIAYGNLFLWSLAIASVAASFVLFVLFRLHLRTIAGFSGEAAVKIGDTVTRLYGVTLFGVLIAFASMTH